MRLVSLAQSRLVQFLVLGGGIFALTPASRDGRRIHFPAGDDAELAQEIADEVLVREARRLGLAEGDAIVRRRLVQKMLLLAEDLGGASRAPSEAELRAFFATHADRYQEAARVRFVHVFAATPERAEALREAVARLPLPAANAPAPPLGDPLPVSRLVDASEEETRARFGADFTAELARLPVAGAWSAPLASKLGWHFVAVLARQPARAASFEEAQAALRLDCVTARREEAVDRFVRDALRRYEIDVGGRRITDLAPPPRTALRSSDSAED